MFEASIAAGSTTSTASACSRLATAARMASPARGKCVHARTSMTLLRRMLGMAESTADSTQTATSGDLGPKSSMHFASTADETTKVSAASTTVYAPDAV